MHSSTKQLYWLVADIEVQCVSGNHGPKGTARLNTYMLYSWRFVEVQDIHVLGQERKGRIKFVQLTGEEET